MARLLLAQEGCQINQRNVRGNSALDMAVETSQSRVVNMLLSQDAKLSHASLDAGEEV
jgi:ankyrin repeat protein